VSTVVRVGSTTISDAAIPAEIARDAEVAATAAGLLSKSANLSDLTNAATARTNLGLAPVAASGSASDITTGTLPDAQIPATVTRDSELTSATSPLLSKSANLSDLTNAATARTNLSLGNVDNTSDANKPVSVATQTALNGKLGTAVGNIVSFTGSAAQWTRVNIINDPSSEATWADRLAFYFDTNNDGVAETRTGYHNEYGELRARPAKKGTVALRVLGHADISTGDLFQVSSPTQTDVYFAVSISQVTSNIPIVLTGTNTITAPNIGVKVSTGTTAPSSPAVGDVWVDTN
jgi:hypothetical protein